MVGDASHPEALGHAPELPQNQADSFRDLVSGPSFIIAPPACQIYYVHPTMGLETSLTGGSDNAICFNAATIQNRCVTSMKPPQPRLRASFAELCMAHSGDFLKDYDHPVISTLSRPKSARLHSIPPAHKMNLSRFGSENLSGSGSGQPSSRRQVPSRRTGLPEHGSMGVITRRQPPPVAAVR